MFLLSLRRTFVLAFFTCCYVIVLSQSPAKLISLQCEYLTDPIGIDTDRPRLSWKLSDKRMGASQTGYQVIVGTDRSQVAKGEGDCWQVKEPKNASQRVVYAGKTLQPFSRYYWAVSITDKEGKETGWSDIASFETGMKEISNWKGSWISDGQSRDEKKAPYFRKEFTITKKIKTARAYVAAAGLFELSINGEKTGDHYLDPMYTRFDRRVLYVTHDITAQIQQGVNAVGVLLGNGWYNHQSTAVWNFHNAPWRARPAFCLDIRIVFGDGSEQVITSGKDWKTSHGPLIFNSIYTAEHYDARREMPGWDKPGFADTAWRNADLRSAPAPVVQSQALQPVRAVEKIEPVSVKKFNDSNYVFDLGKNISGITEISIAGEQGTVIRLRHAERLYPDGHTDQSNIDVHYRPQDDKDPFATDIFILSGKGKETFRPRFNYKGFQYIEVTANRPIMLDKQDVRGYFMHSDVKPAGQLSSSNPLIDKIWKAANQSYLSNLFGYFTDCPQREKNGWTGDAHIASETGLFNFDGITVYEKWLADHRDEQQPNGVLPSIIPTGGWGYEWGNGPDWTSTIAIIPWNIYLYYGDTTLLAHCYDNIKRYVDHINELYPTGLTTWGLGDWIPVKSKSPVELTSTAYYYVDVEILSRAAGLLGKTDDQEYYTALATRIRNAFNAKYLHTSTGIYGNGVQTELSVPLQWGLAPDTMREKVANQLAKRVMADSVKIDVGLLGTKAILNALSENGHADLAYRLASAEKFPSWGWWIRNGATTLYENWPIDSKSDLSLNHIMFGEISAWFFKALGGIRPDPAQPGFRHILLEPHFVNGLASFEVTHESPYGTILSSWSRSKKGFQYKAVIPPNSSATVKLKVPAKKKYYHNQNRVEPGNGFIEMTIPAGTHIFTWK